MRCIAYVRECFRVDLVNAYVVLVYVMYIAVSTLVDALAASSETGTILCWIPKSVSKSMRTIALRVPLPSAPCRGEPCAAQSISVGVMFSTARFGSRLCGPYTFAHGCTS